MKEQETIQSYVDEFKSWKSELQKYWKQIDKCQEMYEFYKREQSDTQSQISLNTPFAIVESMVSKANEANVVVTVNAKGEKGLTEMEKWLSSILKDALDDPDVAQFKGTFRKTREKFFREFLVKGNAVASVEWLKKSTVIGDKKTVLANNPYVKCRNLKSVIFNPTRTLSDSDIYYIESWVKYSDLKNQEYDKKSDAGIYKNLGKLKSVATEDKKDVEDEYYYSNGTRIQKKGEPIHIIERWEGAKYSVIADDQVLIREEEDPFKIGGHNLVFAMNYVVGDRPYAYGEIDAIYMPVRAQDTIVNQSIDIVNKSLRGSYLTKPGSQIDPDILIDIIENGGVAEGDPALIGVVPINPIPAQAFTTIDTIQQAIERAARYSPYSSGVPNQQSDKTAGTMGGIQALQQASEPNFEVKLDALEECFMRPVARIYYKMIANLMSPSDVRYGMLEGKSSDWVKANKAILQGSPTMKDLVEAGYLDQESAQEYMNTVDPMTGEIIPIPGADKAIVFDVDWLIDVRLDNQSAADKESRVNKTMQWIQFAQQMGIQFSPERTAVYVAEKQGIDDSEELMLNEEEKMGQQQQMMAQQEQEMQAQQQQAQAQSEQQMQQQQMKVQADLQKEQMRGQYGLAKAKGVTE